MDRLAAEESRLVRILAVNQGDESEIRKLLFAAVGDAHLGGAQRHRLAVGLAVLVDVEVFHGPAALVAPDRRRPAVLGKGRRDARGKGESRVAPKVTVWGRPGDILLINEGFHGIGVVAIGQAHQQMRKAKGHIAGIVLLAERTPFDIVRALENLVQIAWQGQIGEAPQPEKLRRRGTEQGGVRCGGYFRHLLEHAEVHRRQAVFVDMEQATVGLSAERAVLLLIDPLEQQALVELHGPFQIRTQFLEGGIEQPQLEPIARLRVEHQIMKATPDGFKLLECLGM